jgi:hypothetical protein
VAVVSKAGHRGAVTGHVAVADELTTHGTARDGVVREDAGVVYSPHELLLVCVLDIG